MSRRSVAWLAWGLCLLSVALAVLILLLSRLNGLTLAEMIFGQVAFSATFAVAFPTVGAVIASRRPNNPIGWIFYGIGLSQGIGIFADLYATYALLTAPGSLPGGAVMDWLAEWIWAPGLFLVSFLLLLFPHGELPSRRWRWLAWLAGVVIASMPVIVLLEIALLDWDWSAFGDLASPLLEAIVGAVFLIGLLTLIASLAAPIARWRRARGEEREQLKWFTYASVVFVVAAFGANRLGAAGSVLLLLAVPCLPIAIAIAVLKYRLYDIDVIINRTLVYGTLTAILVLVYVGGVFGLQRVVQTLTGNTQSEFVIVVSTLAIAALFNPLRRRVQTFIDRRFYRRKYDAAQVLAAFSMRLREETDLDALSNDLLAVVEETLQPAHVSLWLREPEREVKG